MQISGLSGPLICVPAQGRYREERVNASSGRRVGFAAYRTSSRWVPVRSSVELTFACARVHGVVKGEAETRLIPILEMTCGGPQMGLASTLVVSRTVPYPIGAVVHTFDRLPPSIRLGSRTLVFHRDSGRVRTDRSSCVSRNVRAALRPGRLRFAFPVEVEAAPWSETQTEIALRPLGRRSLRHRSSYCDAAHGVMDHFAGPVLRALLATTGSPIVGQARLGCTIARMSVVKLEGDLDLGTVGQLRELLATDLGPDPEHVRVDLAELRSLDGAGLEMFTLLTRTVEASNPGNSVTLTSTPDPIRRVIEESDCVELLSVE